MFLHLGADIVVPLKDVIAILDCEAGTNSSTNKEFVRVADDEGFVRRIGAGSPKAMVVTTRNVFFSPISSLTLARRATNPFQTPDPVELVLGGTPHGV